MGHRIGITALYRAEELAISREFSCAKLQPRLISRLSASPGEAGATIVVIYPATPYMSDGGGGGGSGSELLRPACRRAE